MTQLIQNGSFSQPVIPNESGEYINGGGRVPYWYFRTAVRGHDGAVLLNNSIGWEFPIPYPNGNQCVSLQRLGSISQIVDLSNNTYYEISFYSCGRPVYGANPVNVQLYTTNDVFIQNIYQYTPPVSAWTSYTASFSVQTTGSYKISFSGTTTLADHSSAVQNIQLSARTAQEVINQYPLWGAYSAGNYFNGRLSDLTGNGRNAICSGVTSGSGSGNGADANIPYLSGTPTSTIEWPSGSIPQLFTLCSITRYAGSLRQRILQGKFNNFLHGHWQGSRGWSFYGVGNWNSYGIDGNVLDWLVFCGKNEGNIPNNILANNQPIGILGGGNGNNTLTINISEHAEESDWEFTYLLIWEGTLSDTDMAIISSALNDYLETGTIPFTIPVVPSIIQNGSFSQPVIPDNSFRYITGGDVVPYWYFSGAALVNGQTGFAFPIPYPNGNQGVALQNTGSISQIVDLEIGKKYSISFYSFGRPNQANQINVQLYTTNNEFIQNIYQYTPPDSVWTSYTATFSVQTTGSYKISFSGTNQDGDRTSGLNDIQLNSYDLVEPTISPLTIAPKSVGSSPFFVDNPESDSDGSFTYTSSNESVATVENDQLNHGVIITIIGSGETIITATQAATSVYSEGSVHTTFQVNPNAPDDPVLIENGSELIYSMSIPGATYLTITNNVTITEDILAQSPKVLTSNGMYTINRDF
jgi:hypothetical protein